MPEFYAPLENFTATQGRDVQFTCVVNHLGDYRVSNARNFAAEKFSYEIRTLSGPRNYEYCVLIDN